MERLTQRPAQYRFCNYQFDPSTGELKNEHVQTMLQQQPTEILVALLERPGELVTRTELVRRLWPSGTYVDFDRSLNKAVNKLREALEDSAENPKFIETLPRRGYRFIATVSENGSSAPLGERSLGKSQPISTESGFRSDPQPGFAATAMAMGRWRAQEILSRFCLLRQ